MRRRVHADVAILGDDRAPRKPPGPKPGSEAGRLRRTSSSTAFAASANSSGRLRHAQPAKNTSERAFSMRRTISTSLCLIAW